MGLVRALIASSYIRLMPNMAALPTLSMNEALESTKSTAVPMLLSSFLPLRSPEFALAHGGGRPGRSLDQCSKALDQVQQGPVETKHRLWAPWGHGGPTGARRQATDCAGATTPR